MNLNEEEIFKSFLNFSAKVAKWLDSDLEAALGSDSGIVTLDEDKIRQRIAELKQTLSAITKQKSK